MASFEKTLPRAAALPVRLRRPKERILKFREEILLALDTLQKNKLRSALTVLGIVIGITTVITVTSVINGLNENVLGGISRAGLGHHHRLPFSVGFALPPAERVVTRKELEPEWAEEIALLPYVKAASGVPCAYFNRSSFRHGKMCAAARIRAKKRDSAGESAIHRGDLRLED